MLLNAIRHQIKEAQNELLLHYNYNLQGTVIRSHARWVEEGEKNTKYFLTLKKEIKTSNVIHSLKLDSGDYISGNDAIFAEINKFYFSLYSSGGCNPDPFFLGFLSNVHMLLI